MHIIDFEVNLYGRQIKVDFCARLRDERHMSGIDELRTVDQAVLTDIYAAREQNTVGVSSADLAAEIPGSVYCPSLQSVTAYLQANARPGDIILTVGAGDIYKAGEALLKL